MRALEDKNGFDLKINQSRDIIVVFENHIVHVPSCEICLMYQHMITNALYGLDFPPCVFHYLCMGSYASVSSFKPWDFEPSDLTAESSTKLIQAITWKSISSRQSSCKSLMAPNTKNSSTWVEYKNDLFDDYEGMDSGSHLSTLGRLYAWEKKLYEEVKVGLFYNSSVFYPYFLFCDDTASTFVLEWIKITGVYTIVYIFRTLHLPTYKF